MIIGTAGHIDHGKTALIRALTGMDTDRLPEEKKRGISVELGFAFLDAPGGQRIGFVDVPGHERLVHTMVAGATGMDCALLLIAADDGIMPQTREHLAVLSLLGIERGAVVITKIDRVDDTRLQVLHDQVHALISESSLVGASTFAVSSHTGQGLDALRHYLYQLAQQSSQKQEQSNAGFRLAIDRVFSLEGSGTTITGSVHAGTVHIGQELRIVPQGVRVRVRSIHAQNQDVDCARRGQRCALVVAGVARDSVHRGDWAVDPSIAHSTARLDMNLTLWHGEERALRSGTRVHVHVGSRSVLGTVAILRGDTLVPGGQDIAQLVLQQPLSAWWGDRVILRDASGSRTIAGGPVLDPDAPVRYRRSDQRLAALAALGLFDPQERLAALIATQPLGVDLAAFRCTQGLLDVTAPSTGLRHQEGQSDWMLSTEHGQAIREQVMICLAAFHQRHPDQLGPDSARLRRLAAPRLPQALWQAVLRGLLDDGQLIVRGAFLHSPEHGAALSQHDVQLAETIGPHLTDAGFTGAWVRDLAQLCGQNEAQMRAGLARLAQLGQLHQVVKDLYYDVATMHELARIARDTAHATDGELSAAAFRDAVGLGRKRAIQILEYFDRIGLMRRVGNVHRLRTESQLFQEEVPEAAGPIARAP